MARWAIDPKVKADLKDALQLGLALIFLFWAGLYLLSR